MEDKQILTVVYQGVPINISYFCHFGDTKTLLFLHGLGAEKEDFLGAVQNNELGKHTVVGFDFPGHGQSSYPQKYTIDNLVEITNLVIEKLGLKRVVLIGHSMGGLVGLLYLVRFGSVKVKSFINIEGNLTKDDCGFSRYISSLDQESFHKEFGSADALLDLSPSMVMYSQGGKLFDLFVGLPLPKIFVYGEKSEIGHISQLLTRGVETLKIPNSGHHPFSSNPGEFYQAIANYVDHC